MFMKLSGDDGNVANAPDIAEPDPGNTNVAGFPEAEPTSLASHSRVSAPYIPTHGFTAQRYPDYGAPEIEAVSNDVSGTSPGGGQSNRLTPNSSTASEQQQQQQQNLTPGGHLNRSGRNSFEASPEASHQGLGSMPGTSQAEMGAGLSDFTLSDPSPFGIPPGVSASLAPDQPYITDAPSGSDYPIANGWGDITNQTGLTPGVESTLRSIIDMEMWDTTT